MNTYLLLTVSALMAFAIGWLVSTRRARGGPSTESSTDQLTILRKIDRMILSNVSFSYLVQEIVDLLPQTQNLLGGTLRLVDTKTGQLKVQAVSESLQGSAASLKALLNRTVTPEEIQGARSMILQSVNERRVVSGEKLRDFESPWLEPVAADTVQRSLAIASVVVYPVIIEDHLSGAITFYYDQPLSRIGQREHSLMQSVADEVGIAMENSRLLNQLEDMNRQLEQSNSHLQSLDANKDEFISITSHQLRSPLTAVKGYLSMLQEGDFGAIPVKHRPIINQIATSTTEVINLLNDMLSVSKINAERFELTRAPVHLEDIVHDVVNELKPLAREKSLKLCLELPKQPIGMLYLDPLRIRQVLVNFIDNAIKYTKQGKVMVKIELTKQEVTCRVIDTGIGIPAEELNQLFAKFYRARNARQLVTVGSGLGLFVAKRVIEEHHGTCVIESVEGNGSTFGFRLPRQLLAQPVEYLAPVVQDARVTS